MNGYKYRVGQTVKVFDPGLYVNDVETPLSVTMQAAIITGKGFYRGQRTYDVIFLRNNRESRAHFEYAIDE